MSKAPGTYNECKVSVPMVVTQTWKPTAKSKN
jgi:hypothetical protein